MTTCLVGIMAGWTRVRSGLGATAIVVGILLSGAASFARAQSSASAQELRDTVKQYVATWNAHDPSILAEIFAADADMIMGNGPILSGRPAIESWWRDYFAVQEPERTLTIEVQDTRTISADVVLLNVRTTTGGGTAAGTELGARRARGTWVLVQQGDDWLISAMRGMPTEQDRIIRSHDQPNR